MRFTFCFLPNAERALKRLKHDTGLSRRYRAVVKALELLSENPRHPGLSTHIVSSLSGPRGEKVFEAYAEQHTPAAYRIFFFYGRERATMIIFAITPHP